MDDQHRIDLEKRVGSLEKAVEDLGTKIDRLHELLGEKSTAPTKPATPTKPIQPVQPNRVVEDPSDLVRPAAPPPPPPPQPTAPARPAPMSTLQTEPSFQIPDYMKKVEWWLNKVGIGLLLFSVVFLFKYSIDQGWLTPPVRVAFGVALGIGLIVMGLRTYEKTRHFSLVLLGGGLATFYITGFAAFQILNIVSQPAAMAFMVAATVLAFVLSIRQNDAILSLIGVIGGLGTPFLLYTGEGNIPGLVGYTCLILGGTVGIYFFKGWRSVLWVSVLGGWSVLTIALTNTGSVRADQIAVQAGAAFAWLAFWGLPVLREVLSAKRPTRWPKSLLGFADKHLTTTAKDVMDRHVHGLSVSSPLIALGISVATWNLADTDTWGWVCLGATAVYGVVAWRLRSTEQLKNLAYTQGVVGTLLFTVAMYLFFEDHTLLFVLASEAVVLHLVAQRTADRIMKAGAHFLFAIVTVWLLTRLVEIDYVLGGGQTLDLLVDIWVISAAFALSQILRNLLERRVYLLVGFAALAGLLVRELDGNTLLLALAVEAIVIHMIARWLDDRAVCGYGHALFVGLGCWLAERLILACTPETAILNPQALTDITIVAVALSLPRTFGSYAEKVTYRLAAHVTILAWLLRELHTLPNGQGIVTAAWGVYAIGLLIAGLRLNRHQLRQVALVTLLLVVGKLFMVDLAKLETIWRVLLFMGFGGIFLAISYYFQSLWKGAPEDAEDSVNEETEQT